MKKNLVIFPASLLALLFIMATTIKKESFYSAYKSSDETTLNNCITTLKKESNTATRNAYLGALTMKSAEHKFSPISKLSAFNQGKELLESAILSEPNNAEFRFIRLSIQENCPGILGYSSNISTDKTMLIKKYALLDSYVKKFILNYATSASTNLSKTDFK